MKKIKKILKSDVRCKPYIYHLFMIKEIHKYVESKAL